MHVDAEQVLLVDWRRIACSRLFTNHTLAANAAGRNAFQCRGGGSGGHTGTLAGCAGLLQCAVLLRAGGARRGLQRIMASRGLGWQSTAVLLSNNACERSPSALMAAWRCPDVQAGLPRSNMLYSVKQTCIIEPTCVLQCVAHASACPCLI